jgi:dethiobiotin synthetase
MNRVLCVTGTGTEVGKTSVALAALLWARETGLRAGYLKIVQCGSRNEKVSAEQEFQGDAEWLEAAQPGTFTASAIYTFQDAVSPHLAAEKSGAWIDPEWILEQTSMASDRCDLLIVEGAGGAAAPFTREGFSLAEVAARAGWPCLIAGAPGLGTLHQVRTTAEFLLARKVRVAGFAMCQSTPDVSKVYADNVAVLKSLIEAPFFGLVPYCPGLHKRLPLPPAMAFLLARSLADGMATWWGRP